MKTLLMIAATLGASMLGGCATYVTAYPGDGYYYYDYGWGYDGGGGKSRHAGGGRSEPGNEAGMYGARPDGGRGGGGGGGGSRQQ
ncbi:MAG TPA: hypothetical protein VII68_10150 [Casimicrobiaceae bacterium]|jgi:hypothetical protein